MTGRVALAAVVSTPLSTEECTAAVSDRSAGAVGLFIGVVRDVDEGRLVQGLDYEAHPTAEAQLRQLCERIASRNVIAVAAVHRVGSLKVGEIAVVVAVSSEHRGDAMAATQDLIDLIKTEAPIWKHQTFVEGDGPRSEWVGVSTSDPSAAKDSVRSANER